jgi:hypothetical protein
MGQTFTEGSLSFTFPDSWLLCRPQDLAFYSRQFQSFCGGCKEIDFIAYDPLTKTLWLLEVKDFRISGRLKPTSLHEEMAEKVRDTLALIVSGGLSSMSHDDPATTTLKGLWTHIRRAANVRVALHCEQPKHRSKLFPCIANLSNIADQLRRSIRAVDPRAIVMNDNSVPGVPWTVSP